MKTIFIGPCGGGNVPINGASVKNFHILSRLKVLIPGLMIVDTENWKKNRFILIKLILLILRYPSAKYILSLNSGSANKLLRILNKLAPKAVKIYWVIGGALAKDIEHGRFSPSVYSSILQIIVEGESMKKHLGKIGLKNVCVMPNFKSLVPISKTSKQDFTKTIKFVFLSRIIPQKGVDLIFDAVERLNEKYSDRYTVDFYGPIDENYSDCFRERLQKFQNVTYRGFLDLRIQENYTELSKYSVMLFPTYWSGEGCPGIVIDAYMCGLPIIASDWNLNCDYIKDGKSGILIQPKDSSALYEAMEKIINGKIDLNELLAGVQDELSKFDIDKVLSKSNLQNIGII